MSDTKISVLPTGAAATGSELLPLVQAGQTKSLALDQLLAHLLDANPSPGTPGFALLASQVVRTGRSSPHANFAWFTADFTVSDCQGPGRAQVVQDIYDVFLTKFSSRIGSSTVYVHPNGNDSNDGSSWRAAFLTLAQALRSTACGTIYLWPGQYELSDFRYTDTYGANVKLIIAPFGGATVMHKGDDPNAATWQASVNTNGVYQMSVASTNVPTRVLRKDLVDKYGLPTPMPAMGTLSALGGVNFGWAYDGAFSSAQNGTTAVSTNTITGVANAGSLAQGLAVAGAGIPAGTTITGIAGGTVTMSNAATASGTVTITYSGRLLYVRDAMSANVNTTTKANLSVVYGDASGDARTLIYSTTCYWENITFLGYVSVLNVTGQATPQFWAKRCNFRYGNAHAVLVQGGYSYTQDCTADRGAADGANYNSLNGITSHGVEINYVTHFQGDVDSYGQAQTTNPQGNGANKNGTSNHDSYVVRINGSHADCFGPNVADTAPSYSWNLGVHAGYNAMPPGSIPSNPRYGILNQGNTAWCDGCSVTGNDAGFNSDSGAQVNVFNSFGTHASTNGGTFAPYLPS